MPRQLVVSKIAKSFEEGIASLQVVDAPREPLQPDEVRVSNRAVGLNFFDLLQLVGKYQNKPELPFSPCCEGAGVVTEIGEGVNNVKVGDRVFYYAWTTGAARDEYVLPSLAVHLLPEDMTFGQGAGFWVGYLTAYHGLVHRGDLKKGEVLLVTGAAGGMGVAAVQLGKALGATVIAAAGDDAKLAQLKGFGADHLVNYRSQNLRDEVLGLTDGNGVDVVYEVVGGSIFKDCVRCMNTQGGGRLLVIGFASGEIPKLPINLALIKGFSLVGVRSGAQMMMDPDMATDMIQKLYDMAVQGKLRPAVFAEQYPLDQAGKAFDLLKDRKVVGKAVITWEPTARL